MTPPPLTELEKAAQAFRSHRMDTPLISSGEEQPSDIDMDGLQMMKKDVANYEKEVDSPMWTQKCTQCSGMCHLMWDAKQRGYLWQCRKGDRNCPYQWTDLEEQLTPAFGTRLCTECQQDALAKVNINGRWGWKCPRCQDFTGAGLADGHRGLPLGRGLQLREDSCGAGAECPAHQWSNGFQFLGWFHDEDLAKELTLDRLEFKKHVNEMRTMVFWYQGSCVPAQLGVRLRSPLGTRVLATTSGKGSWNILDIQRGSSQAYDLGGCFKVLVLQEVTSDFIGYLQDQLYDPIEVTMSKNEKKILLKSLDGINQGDETYWDMLEDPDTWSGRTESEAEIESSDALTNSALATTTTAKVSSGALAKRGVTRPKVPPVADIIERGRTQYDHLPCSMEMHGWVRDLLELKLRILWREYFGQVVVICLDAKTTLLPKVGPGARPMRWTAACNGDHPEEWTCLEERVMGDWRPPCPRL